jgi:hypothetical protein
LLFFSFFPLLYLFIITAYKQKSIPGKSGDAFKIQ